jgi:hypothetical protein
MKKVMRISLGILIIATSSFLLLGCLATMAGFAFGVPMKDISEAIVEHQKSGQAVDVYLDKNNSSLYIIYGDVAPGGRVQGNYERIGSYFSCVTDSESFTMRTAKIASRHSVVKVSQKISKRMNEGLPVDVYKSANEMIIVFDGDKSKDTLLKDNNSYHKIGSYCSGIMFHISMSMSLCR